MPDTYYGKACGKCGNTERYKRDNHLTCRDVCFKDRKHGDIQAHRRRYNHSIKGYLRNRKYYVKAQLPLLQQELEEVQKEIKELENVIFKNK